MRSEEDPVLDVPISVLKRGRGPWKRGACVRACLSATNLVVGLSAAKR